MNLRRYENKNFRRLSVGRHDFYFSYETLVAYAGPLGRVRTSTNYSRTTNKHLRHANLSDLPELEQEALDALADKALVQHGLETVYRRLGASDAVIDGLGMKTAFPPVPA